MALTRWATTVLQWRGQWAANSREYANLQKPSQFGLFSATREHEGGLASNRGSACRGEYVPRPCTHRPSHHGSWIDQTAPSGSEEHKYALQSLMRISYAVVWLKNTHKNTQRMNYLNHK